VIAAHAKGRMPSKSTLIIKDYTGNEIFNINFLNRNTIYFTGAFYYASNTDPVVVAADKVMMPRHNEIQGGCSVRSNTAIAIN
jgi:hypothetical protein